MATFKRRSLLRIPSYLCGTDDRLTLVGLAAIFQEEAWLHARDLGFALTDPEDGLFWVLSRVVWHVRAWPEWDREVVSHTWPSGMDRLLAIREFSLHAADELEADPQQAEPLVRATSGWVIMDAHTGRPVRPEKYLAGRLTIEERVLPVALSKVSAPPLPALDATTTYVTAWHPVRRSAIDRNNHVNNTTYLQWMDDARSAQGPTGATTIVVHYLAETRAHHHYRVVGELNRAWIQIVKDPTPAEATAEAETSVATDASPRAIATAASVQQVELASLPKMCH